MFNDATPIVRELSPCFNLRGSPDSSMLLNRFVSESLENNANDFKFANFQSFLFKHLSYLQFLSDQFAQRTQ